MVVLRLEMWPDGNQAKARSLGELRVSNVGGNLAEGNYLAEYKGDGGRRVVEIRGWSRQKSAWALVYEALARLGAGGWRMS